METTTQTGSADRSVSLFEIGTQMEETFIDFSRVKNLIQLFDETIEDEVSAISRIDGYAETFVRRYDMLRAVIYSMQTTISSALDSMEHQIEAVYAEGKKARGMQ